MMESTVAAFKNADGDDVYYTCNGKIIDPADCLEEILNQDVTFRVHCRLRGGKGGFGSMLRALGAQIEKTTNREACRDLSGRRMRDVNNEKTISDWLEKQKADEEARAKKKKEKLDKLLNPPRHILSDSSYITEIKANAEKVEDALKQGLEKVTDVKQSAIPGTSSLGKRQHSSRKNGHAKKQKIWLGIDDSDLSSEEEHIDESYEQLASPVEDSRSVFQSNASFESAKKNVRFSETVDEREEEETGNDERKTEKTSVDCSVVGEEDMKGGIGTGEEAKIETSVDKHIPSNQGETTNDNVQVQVSDEALSLKSFTSAEELEVFGLEKLKCELMKHGLKCGGTLQQRAQRLFLLKDTPIEKLDKSLFSKSGKKSKS